MICITDAADPAIAPYRAVGDPAALERRGVFVAEGRLVVSRLIDAPRFAIESIAVTPAAARAMAPALDRLAAPVYVCDTALLEAITGFNFHRGCLAIARRPDVPSISAFAQSQRLLALEGVGNPDNVGGLFRAALALGAGGLLLDPTTADPLYRKAVRTSMGAVLGVPFARVTPWPDALDELRASARIIALTPDPRAVPLGEVAVRSGERLILMLGSEGNGLSAAALRYADRRVRIPVSPEADSLNVVVAAGIALYSLRPSMANGECSMPNAES